MTNHTNPDGSHDFLDPDDSGSPLHGVCTRSYPSANKDIGEAIGSGEQVVTYRLFASAAMSSGEDGVAPFFASEFAVNYRKDRIVGGSERGSPARTAVSHPLARPCPPPLFHGTKPELRRS